MLRSRLTAGLYLGLYLILSSVGAAASLDVTGVSGAPGAGPGDSGAPGQPVTAALDNFDPENDATATGGNGGAGGPASVSPAVPPGAGGSGGSAFASATGENFPDFASASARGGNGGNGGTAGSHTGPPPISASYLDYGPGGNGGDAEARASLDTSNYADAEATAVGGSGGLGSTDLGLPSTRGTTGRATALAHAVGVLPTANASATGSHALAQSDATSIFDQANAYSEAIGVTGAAGLLEPTDSLPTAIASARAHNADDANASANATGNTAGTSRAFAEAYSDSGRATALATQNAGAAPPTNPETPPYHGPFPALGGAGGSTDAVDLVRGATTGLLTLSQTANGQIGSNGYAGGAASSALHAVNPLGGNLRADSNANAGAGSAVCDFDQNPYVCRSGTGGNAVATLHAAGAFNSSIDARATANGGNGGQDYSPYGINGNASATATAEGAGTQFVHAGAGTRTGAEMDAAAHALGPGGIAGVHAQVSLDALAPDGLRYAVDQDVAAEAGMRVATTGSDRPDGAPFFGGYARLFARPVASDVTTWFADRPLSSAAAAERGVLALGSLGRGGEIPGGTYSPTPEMAVMHGSVSLDLTASDFTPSDTIALSFLGDSGSFALLDVALDRDGQELFHRSFSHDATDLTDLVVELGAIATPGHDQTRFTLSWTFQEPEFSAREFYSMNFAFLGPSPLPEPAALTLFCVAAGLLAVVRRR